jgi:hypothetical protein
MVLSSKEKEHSDGELLSASYTYSQPMGGGVWHGRAEHAAQPGFITLFPPMQRRSGAGQHPMSWKIRPAMMGGMRATWR